ncbi:XK-related protein 6-like [Centruroides sculpturatus]|uniref:XK-related protein 6-like n=1 Tax=Centruroides sculpturatus TaxID=218467 RepID=UPI000C6D4457|nr:XK-related protein 6-like [Centruroides sculpturatus]
MVCWSDFPYRYKEKQVPIELGRTDIVDHDTADALPKKLEFTWIDVSVILFSIGTFVLDTGSDSFLAYIHYKNYSNGERASLVYFVLTLVFVLVPTVTMTAFSLRWYVIDHKYAKRKVPLCRWILRTVLLFFQLGPVLRYIDCILFGLKSQKDKSKLKQKEYFQEMLYEDVDATLLRLFESFMEAAPQLLLQIYILLKIEFSMDEPISWKVIVQIVSVLISLVSISWAISAYFRALRFSLPKKKNMGWIATIFHASWHFFVISARIFALGLFASQLPEYLPVVCILHWFIMTLWIISMKTNFCINRFEEVLYNAVVGIIFIFCYFNPVDSPTRHRYFIYYSVMITENSILMLIWNFYGNNFLNYRLPIFVVHYALFLLGFAFMVSCV